ncbi:hypothetical protein CLV24_11936 [Pontibacter ummariensis]|uniref:Uncharacterized protein n=1 Tax=Pontibacter ummariensis TaxID=1610492 RepID=A0A239IWU1_9BACT|nr:hypothetical protein [Pontibacter ummariensis]PRY08985.1 hypothetical protein CLV24_11936 [Pontibacter ummariensis]SNS97688.1 hypothetical protein SAMN06296052_11936 [Pontibacter ummariensis]
MENKLLLPILLVSILSCNTHSTEAEQQENALPIESSNPVAQAVVTGKNVEYLDWKSVRINGKFPLTTTVQNINGLLGKPDSVNSINWDETCSSDFRSEESKLAYYSGYHFEQFGDSLDFQSVDFRKSKGLFLHSNDLKLNSSTTLEEIKTRFPNAAKDIEKMDVYEIGEVDAIALPPSKGLSDGHWLLMFQNGKLIRTDDWFPC